MQHGGCVSTGDSDRDLDVQPNEKAKKITNRRLAVKTSRNENNTTPFETSSIATERIHPLSVYSQYCSKNPGSRHVPCATVEETPELYSNQRTAQGVRRLPFFRYWFSFHADEHAKLPVARAVLISDLRIETHTRCEMSASSNEKKPRLNL